VNELIKVNYENDRITVLARDLHEFLEIKTGFRHWFPRMCEYGFEEGIDFNPVIFDHPQNGQPIKDYQLTLDMAKEIAMIQRNECGKQARQYFIECEKKVKSGFIIPRTLPEALRAYANEVELNEKLQLENTKLGKEVDYKTDVIHALTSSIDVASKRQLLNRVVRYKGANFRERYHELYKQFEMKYHMNLELRITRYNTTHKPKVKNKLDYIDNVLDMIPELYEIACKLYEGDIQSLCNELYGLNSEVPMVC